MSASNSLDKTFRTRVDVNDDTAVVIWAKRFGISVEQLKRLVDQVGPDADDIGNFLRGQGKRAANRKGLPKD